MSLCRRLLPALVILLFLPGVPGATSTTGISLPAAFSDPQPPETDSLRVAGEHHVAYAVFLRHVRARNPQLDEIYLRTLYRYYYRICRTEGVSLLVALAQMIHETDYLRFTGSVRAVQYNYAGIGATSATNPGNTFPDMRTGVKAHVQHLKAYANDEPLVLPLVDPRFHFVVRGSGPTVHELTGRWATDPEYGVKLTAHARRLTGGS